MKGERSMALTFSTPITKCGIKKHLLSSSLVEYQLMLIVQESPYIQKASTNKRILLKCSPEKLRLHTSENGQNQLSRRVDGASEEEEGNRLEVRIAASETGEISEEIVDAIKCRMEMFRGRLPFLKTIHGPVDIGDEMTILLYIHHLRKDALTN